jgi:hypothetical protein
MMSWTPRCYDWLDSLTNGYEAPHRLRPMLAEAMLHDFWTQIYIATLLEEIEEWRAG